MRMRTSASASTAAFTHLPMSLLPLAVVVAC
jgi:hypothetical protein